MKKLNNTEPEFKKKKKKKKRKKKNVAYKNKGCIFEFAQSGLTNTLSHVPWTRIEYS